MERIAPGAFTKTLREQTPKLLLQHSRDPQVGLKPIGEVLDARKDARGGYGKSGLFEGVPEMLLAGLRAGEYGASFRFAVVRGEVVVKPAPSDYTPRVFRSGRSRRPALASSGHAPGAPTRPPNW
jgi:phage head maturation protease